MAIDFAPSIKQDRLFKAFHDEKTTQVLYGGAASGGKSYGLCALVVMKCLECPGIRVLMGREELKNLKATTVKTLFKLLAEWKFEKDKHYKYNQTEGVLTFYNGSEILLKQLKYEPSDPECNWLGSLEITFACVDEAPEVVEKVIDILHSRCGRWLNDEYKIKPMLLMTCNPSRGHCYSNFYKPSLKGKLKKNRMFIPATIDDNDRMPKGYKQHLLDTLDYNDRQRLVHGKWEFDSDPNALVKFSNIDKAYDYIKPQVFTGQPYLTCDIAFLSDKCLLVRWVGLCIVEIIEIDKEKEKPEEIIKALMIKHSIPKANVCYDATGAGLYLKNYLKGSYIFHSGAKPITKKKKDKAGEKEFEHLKTQVYYMLSQEIMKDDSAFKIFDSFFREELIEEVLCIKTLPKEKLESVIKMIKKDEIKKLIGRSPDILDAIAMRFVYEIKVKYKRNF